MANELADIKQDFNVSKMCRTCLIETDDEMQEIFGETPDTEVLSILQVLLSANILVRSKHSFLVGLQHVFGEI